jgi:8-oxo-dGTP pyrophosphatase MutT (NUDIX family)
MFMLTFHEFITLVENKQDITFGAGVCIFCPKTKRFLLQKRGPRVTDPGQHDWFGGGVDEGENVRQGARRELGEEGGIWIDEKSLYPLAVYGKEPDRGLGGYHIFLLTVAEEFKCIPSADGDTNDEVVSADWIGASDLRDIQLHARVLTLFADPGFKDAMKDGVRTCIARGHVAKPQ